MTLNLTPPPKPTNEAAELHALADAFYRRIIALHPKRRDLVKHLAEQADGWRELAFYRETP